MEEVFIAVTVFSAVFGITYVIVTARNRERLSMIEKGINPLDYKPKSNNGGLLKWALLVVGVGIGFFVGSIFEAYTTIDEVPVYFGSVMFFGGLGLLIAYLINRKSKEE
jgi:hypothetical protein